MLRKLILTLLVSYYSASLLAQLPNPLTLEKDRQFDFWVGEWDVNLRIKQPDQQWLDQVKSQAKIYLINDGRAVLELWNDLRPTGIKGFSLRYYDFQKEKWVLWLNWPGPNASGMSSLEGEFRHGRGEFFSGKGDTLTRYSFSDITPYSLRWDDAFTKDGGKTWTHGWIMEFTRTQQEPDWPSGTQGHTYDQGGRCNLPAFDAFRGLVGDWEGEVREKQGSAWKTGKASLNGFEVLAGCAVLNFMTTEVEGETAKEFSIKTYNTYAKKLTDGRLGSNDTDIMRQYFTDFKEGNKYSLTEFDQQNEQSILRKYDWDLSQENQVQLVVSEKAKGTNENWQKVKEVLLKKK